MRQKGTYRSVGQMALRAMFGLPVPEPAVQSFVGPGARKVVVERGGVRQYFRSSAEPPDTPVGHLEFALKHEAFDLALLAAFMRAIDPGLLASWVQAEPTGAFSRRAFFFYEALTGRRLDVPDRGPVRYVAALDPRHHLAGAGRPSPRHKVTANLLGTPALAPTVRLTGKLAELLAEPLAEEAAALTREFEPGLIARAANYLYRKETRSTYAIESEVPSRERQERFMRVLARVGKLALMDKAGLVEAQNAIVDLRYAEGDWRDGQNYVGQTLLDYRERVDFIPPRPQDVPELMAAWADAGRQLLGSSLHPVVLAALISFTFVFIHPFIDGNGRLSRLLVHHVLERTRFSQGGAVFPVSAAILRDLRGYHRVLDELSGKLLLYTMRRKTPAGGVEVLNETIDLYRHFDATDLVEYLFERVESTIREDLKGELEFLSTFDAVRLAIAEVVDMPDHRADLLARLLLQGRGRLSKAKRTDFAELSEAELERIEAGVADLLPAEVQED